MAMHRSESSPLSHQVRLERLSISLISHSKSDVKINLDCRFNRERERQRNRCMKRSSIKDFIHRISSPKVLTEYILVSITSAVTVTMAGVVKEAVTILVAVFYFHDQFTWLKGVGLIIILVGVSLFNWYKYQKLQKGELGEENVAKSSATDAAERYVILEEMDDLDDGPLRAH